MISNGNKIRVFEVFIYKKQKLPVPYMMEREV